jgi:hypothetical protein
MLGIILQIAGAVAISVGLGIWIPTLGIVTAGIFAILFGLALENK